MSSLVFNHDIAQIAPSASVVLMAKAKSLIAAGEDIVDFSGGEPDFDTPRPIVDEAIRQLNLGYTHYTVGNGLPELRTRIADKLWKENRIPAKSEEIIVTAGAKLAIYYAVRAMINPGDDVMVLNPGWVSYHAIIKSAGGNAVPVEVKAENHMAIVMEDLEAAWTEKTRMLMINYPNNPTGQILEEVDLQTLCAFMKKHPDLILLSDEIYERIVFDDRKNLSPASIPDIADRVITVNGFSKSVAMTGWRIGYLHAPGTITKIITKLFSHTLTCVSGFIQKAAIKAFDCDDEIEVMRLQYQHRRDLFVNGLNHIDHVSCIVPLGAFYAWVKFDIDGMTDQDVAAYLLEKHGVVGVPGTAYGLGGEKHVRFSFASSDDVLKEGLRRIEKAVKELTSKNN